MRFLLDTHVFLWATGNAARLDPAMRDAITSPDNDLALSSVSVWEISIKRAAGRLDFPIERLGEILVRMEIDPLPITVAHALEAGALPRHHQDPFDRMLVAQARVEGYVLMTEHGHIVKYDVPVFGRG